MSAILWLRDTNSDALIFGISFHLPNSAIYILIKNFDANWKLWFTRNKQTTNLLYRIICCFMNLSILYKCHKKVFLLWITCNVSKLIVETFCKKSYQVALGTHLNLISSFTKKVLKEVFFILHHQMMCFYLNNDILSSVITRIVLYLPTLSIRIFY